MTRGISTRITSLGFDVFRLHHTADPDSKPHRTAHGFLASRRQAGSYLETGFVEIAAQIARRARSSLS